LAMNTTTLGGGTQRFLLIAMSAFAATIALGSLPARAASSGECISVRIDAPFRLPDGVLRPAGELRLCDSRSFSPVTQFHRILVNGSAVGVFPSRRRSAEIGPVDSPEVVFERDADGTLQLVGYILPVAGRGLAFRLKGEGESWQAARHEPIGGGSVAPVAAIIASAH
jgi:hypothetical protein